MGNLLEESHDENRETSEEASVLCPGVRLGWLGLEWWEVGRFEKQKSVD